MGHRRVSAQHQRLAAARDDRRLKDRPSAVREGLRGLPSGSRAGRRAGARPFERRRDALARGAHHRAARAERRRRARVSGGEISRRRRARRRRRQRRGCVLAASRHRRRRAASVSQARARRYRAQRAIVDAGLRREPVERRGARRLARLSRHSARRPTEPMRRLSMRWLSCLALAVMSSVALAQTGSSDEPGVTAADIAAGFEDPTRWLTFSGDYSGQRHSPLRQITPRNVRRLSPQWTFQSGTYARGRGFETTPLALDGVLYVTGPNNYAWAIDARTGRPFWEYRRTLPNDLTYGANAPVNRGFGILGDRLFMLTLDAHLLAFDRRSGVVLWDVELADYRIGYAATLAPLVVEDKVIVGISGGEYPTRGFVDAYDPATGVRVWRFYTVPAPGEPGSDTWPNTESAGRGGGGTWMTGSYDARLGLLYWGTGNPNPTFHGADRGGDNLYTASL